MTLAETDATKRARAAAYGVTALVVLSAWPLLAQATFRTTHEVHTVLETIATLLALIIALVALIRYHSRPSRKLFYFCAAFATAVLLGAVHTFTTSAFVAEPVLAAHARSPFGSQSGWSGFLAVLPLAVLLWMSTRSSPEIAPEQGPFLRDWRLAVGLFALALIGLVALVAGVLPAYYRSAGPLIRPLDLVPAVFFILALASLLRSGGWARDDLDHWIALGLILAAAAHTPYLVLASGPSTPLYDAAHLLKALSFTCILVGLVLSMDALFRQADASGRAMAEANAVLRESEAKLGEAQRLAHIGSWDWDVAGDRITWSDEMYRVYGYRPGEVDVRMETFLERVHPDDRALAERVVGQAMVDQAPFEFIHRIVRPDGEVRVLQGRGAIVAGPDGQVIRMWGTGQDITERRMAEEALRASEEHFRSVAESATQAIISTDARGDITFWNQAAETIFGYTEAEVRGRSVDLLVPVRYRKEHRQGIERLERGEPERAIGHTLQVFGRHQDGHEIPLEVSLSRGRAGRGGSYTAIVQDVSRRLVAEAELAEAARRLADSREAERLRLAQEIHDGPLQDLYGVRLFLGDVAKRPPGGRPTIDEAQAMLRDIIDRLRGICHDLRPPALVPFGLEVAIRSHAEHFRAAHPELGLDLDLDPDKQRLPERTRLALYRIYQQAMDNVIRHAQAEHVLVRLVLAGDHAVTLSVTDDGCGFDVPRHWLKLARQGHLGLLGAAERAEAIGGRLEVESRPGEGTLVRVSAPIVPGGEATRAAAADKVAA